MAFHQLYKQFSPEHQFFDNDLSFFESIYRMYIVIILHCLMPDDFTSAKSAWESGFVLYAPKLHETDRKIAYRVPKNV